MKDESYYENLDKRTKEYKTWVAIKQSQIDNQVTGAGDVVEAFTKATGIKTVVENSLEKTVVVVTEKTNLTRYFLLEYQQLTV